MPHLNLMLYFILLFLFGLSVVDSTVITLPDHLQNGTELLELFNESSTVLGGPTSNETLLGNAFDHRFSTTIALYPDVRISENSTYMNLLMAMIKLSYSEGTNAYAGETFSFLSYKNVRIRIITSGSGLQYQYAIWGLFKAAQFLTTNSVFPCIIMDLYWSGSGVLAQVGVIEIFPDPLPDIAGNKEIQHLMGIRRRVMTPPNSLEIPNFTSIGNNETDLAAFANNGRLVVFLELQGPKLSVREVFMTIFHALVHIASFGTADVVHNFEVRDMKFNTEFVYEHYGAPRTSPPFFTYHEAARALRRIPQYMFREDRFEAVTIVVEVDGTPVGTGFLRKHSSTSAISSQKL